MDSSSARAVWVYKTTALTGRRGHMGIYIPNLKYASSHPRQGTSLGTIIHVTGAPMAGFTHEFKRNFNFGASRSMRYVTQLGTIDGRYIQDPPSVTFSTEAEAYARHTLDGLALQIRAPGPTPNFLDPAQAENIRDCQDWALEYVSYLANYGILPSSAVDQVQQLMDPKHGVALRPVGTTGTQVQTLSAALSNVAGPSTYQYQAQISNPSPPQQLSNPGESIRQTSQWAFDQNSGRWYRQTESGEYEWAQDQHGQGTQNTQSYTSQNIQYTYPSQTTTSGGHQQEQQQSQQTSGWTWDPNTRRWYRINERGETVWG